MEPAVARSMDSVDSEKTSAETAVNPNATLSQLEAVALQPSFARLAAAQSSEIVDGVQIFAVPITA